MWSRENDLTIVCNFAPFLDNVGSLQIFVDNLEALILDLMYGKNPNKIS